MSTTSLPLVTVVTPTFNRAPFLIETIESVLAQTYPRIEYVVYDDGSTDNTPEILRRYGGKLQWHSHPNMGETRTVNKAWRQARGEFVFTVSSDDPVLPDLVETAVQFMTDHPDVLAAYPDWQMVDEQSQPVQHIKSTPFDFAAMVAWHHCMPGPGTVIRRKAFEVAGVRDERYRFVGDYEYWLRLGLYGPLANINKSLATWRRHPGNLTTAAPRRVIAKEHVAVIARLLQRPDLPKSVKKVRRQALSMANYIAGWILLESDPQLAKRYIAQSLLYCPLRQLSYPPTGFQRSHWVMSDILCPQDLKAWCRHFLNLGRFGLRGARWLARRLPT